MWLPLQNTKGINMNQQKEITKLVLERNNLIYNIEQYEDSVDFHFSDGNITEAEEILIGIDELKDEIKKIDNQLEKLGYNPEKE